MSNFGEISIEGGWLGTYAYRGLYQAMPPVRFEARFEVSATGDGHLTGIILDDGALGEATIDGSISGRTIKFTKTYRADPTRIGWAEYVGSLSDDGMQINGTWRLTVAQGIWEARRRWQEEQEPEAVLEPLRQRFDREDALTEAARR